MNVHKKVEEGCGCSGWKACYKRVGIKYSGFWDEHFDDEGNHIPDTYIHEWHINGTLIRRCPWCGKELPYETKINVEEPKEEPK